MEENNFALLSQEEIDALVNFLNEKNTTMDTGILSQDSIDRVINLLSSGNKEKTDSITGFEELDSIVDNGVIKGLELKFMEDADENQIALYVVCGDDTIYITPLCLEYRQIVEDSSSWGYAIDPYRFNKIANVFEIDYTEETYNKVLKKFAKVMYGSENAKIASIYLPDAASVANHLSEK